jgi:uncharacterized protein
MHTPWGELPVSDAHVHFFSRRFIESLTRTSVPGWTMPPADPSALAHIWAGELDRHGVDRCALIASVPGDEDSVAAAVRAFPERFYGYFMVDPLAPAALNHLRHALDSGLRVACFFPAMHRYSIAGELAQPLLDAVAAHPGAAVFVHCGALTVGVRKLLGLPSPFDLRFSNPIDLHPVALRYPATPFVIPHFGAGYFREALMVADLCPNVYFDTSSTNSWMRYHEPALDLRRVFRRALEVLGPSRLLFGTDSSFFPRGWHRQIFEDQSRALYELGLDERDAALILGANLTRVLAPPDAKM